MEHEKPHLEERSLDPFGNKKMTICLCTKPCCRKKVGKKNYKCICVGCECLDPKPQ